MATSTESNVSVAFVGGGQMAAAMIVGLLRSGWRAEQFAIVEPSSARRLELEASLSVQTYAVPCAQLRDAEVVVWAVKPQVLRDVVKEAGPYVRNALQVSIAAGVRSEDLAEWVSSRRVVRVMPNLAALVGAGVSGIVALDGADESDRALVKQMFDAIGYSFWVESDQRLDAVTAVSGSGPGYVFYFMEAFQAAAELIGFGRDEARDLVLQTLSGAVRHALASDSDFSQLRQSVASQRGTTEAALAVLDRERANTALAAAVLAAYTRAGELSLELGATSTEVAKN